MTGQKRCRALVARAGTASPPACVGNDDQVGKYVRTEETRVSFGVALTFGIAIAAFTPRIGFGLSGVNPMTLAVVLGIAFNAIVGTPARAKAGVSFVLRRLLRLGMILLGLQLTLAQVIETGASGISIIVGSIVASFVLLSGWDACWILNPALPSSLPRALRFVVHLR